MRGLRTVSLVAAVAAGVLVLTPAAAAPSGTCLVVSDAAGDPTELWVQGPAPADERIGDAPDRASDLRSVRMGDDGTTLVTEIRVRDLQNRADGPGNVWQVAWRSAWNHEITVWAERTGSGDATFGWSRDGDSGTAAGALIPGRETIRIAAPAAMLGAIAGQRLTSIQARTWDLPSRLAAAPSLDAAPDETDHGVAYVAGVPCAEQEIRACPVVLDPVRDAGTLARAGQRDLPESPAALDLRAAGAEADADTIRVSVRVPRPTAAPPPGYTTVGWTVSWWDGTDRWFAQASRSSGGTQFIFGIDGGTIAPTGPMDDGLFTTGRITGAKVEIDVPRAVFGSAAAAGTRWTKFGATSWALSESQTDELNVGRAEPFRVFDETPLARWRVGVTCGA